MNILQHSTIDNWIPSQFFRDSGVKETISAWTKLLFSHISRDIIYTTVTTRSTITSEGHHQHTGNRLTKLTGKNEQQKLKLSWNDD